MPAKKGTRRSFRTKNHTAKPQKDQELIDDQKFQQKLESKGFTDRIEGEANEAILCRRLRRACSILWGNPIYFVPWFVRKLTAEIFSGVIMQLLSLLFGLAFALGKSIARMRRAEVLVFANQVVFFLFGLVAFLLFSVEMFRSVTTP